MSSGERQRRPSAHYVKNINGLDDKKLTLKNGNRSPALDDAALS